MDSRPLREGNEINPDVLGYIFEKYINQKQMGPYYTKKDITGYIARNTVIPYLFDAARKQCRIAFDGSSPRQPAAPKGLEKNSPVDSSPGTVARGTADVLKGRLTGETIDVQPSLQDSPEAADTDPRLKPLGYSQSSLQDEHCRQAVPTDDPLDSTAVG